MLLVRHPDESLTSWVRQVSDAATFLYHRAHIRPDELWNGTRILVACEDLNSPTAHMGLTSVRGLLDTATVIGGLMRAFGDMLILVPPAGFGKAPLQTYPTALVGPSEKRGKGCLQHARAAWDQSFAAADMARQEAGRT